jgi:hypothetical protein
MKKMLAAVAMPLLAVAACTDAGTGPQSERQPIGENHHLERMVVLEQPPVIAAQLPQDLPIAARAASRIDRASLAGRQSSRTVSTDALPFLTETAIGRDFLASAMPRAIARGMPAEFCPAAAIATAPTGSALKDVASRALESCIAQLPPGDTGCGCRIMALDDLLLVPREETAYATGTTARLRSKALGLDLVLVAEEEPGEPMLLRDLRGAVARITRGEKESVTLEMVESGHRFTGQSIPVGYRRGRIAERIYVADDVGNKITVLVGFAPSELADTAAAWLAWPGQG